MGFDWTAEGSAFTADDLRAFDQVTVKGAIHVRVVCADQFAIAIDGQIEGGSPYRLKRGVLTVIGQGRDLRATISMAGQLAAVRTDGACTASVDAGVANADLTMLVAKGASTIEILDAAVDNLGVEVSGAARLTANVAAMSTFVRVSGASRTILVGSTGDLHTDVSGAATLNCESLKFEQLKTARTSGASNFQLGAA